MVTKRSFWRGTARGATGLAIAGAAVVGVALLANFQPPQVAVATPAISIDTVANNERVLGCTGGFAALGLDTARSGVAIPTGDPQITQIGGKTDKLEFTEGSEGTASSAVHGPVNEPLAASERLDISAETLRGVAAVNCAEPLSDQWIVGGDTSKGGNAALTLTNPGQRPATVKIHAFNDKGALNASQPAGVLVPAKTSRTVSVNGIVPVSRSFALHVVSAGSAVTATLSSSQISDIHPNGIDVVPSQSEPFIDQVMIGMGGTLDEAEHTDKNNAINQVRLLAPESSANATVYAMMPSGEQKKVAQAELKADQVQNLNLANWPKDALAMRVTSDAPIVASGYSRRMVGGEADFAWLASAPLLAANTETPAALVSGSSLVLANPGTDPVEVTITDASDSKKSTKATVKPGAATTVKTPSAKVLMSADGAFMAGVRIASNEQIAAYPVQPLSQRESAIQVYPK